MINQYVYDGEKDFSIKVIYSKRKSIGLEVKTDGRVIARAPLRLTDRDLKLFLEKHRAWVYARLEERNNKSKSPYSFPEYESLSALQKKEIRQALMERVLYYSKVMGVDFGRIAVRNQRTRWGSCSSKGNLNFNYRLYYLPMELLDYVVVHELAHRIHMNHSKEFWNEVEKVVPDYRIRRKALKNLF